MSFEITWADKKAKKSFDVLPSSIQPRVIKAIKSLAAEPRPSSSKKLGGHLKGILRLRIGDYRLLYDIDDNANTVILIHVDHRRQIYR